MVAKLVILPADSKASAQAAFHPTATATASQNAESDTVGTEYPLLRGWAWKSAADRMDCSSMMIENPRFILTVAEHLAVCAVLDPASDQVLLASRIDQKTIERAGILSVETKTKLFAT